MAEYLLPLRTFAGEIITEELDIEKLKKFVHPTATGKLEKLDRTISQFYRRYHRSQEFLLVDSGKYTNFLHGFENMCYQLYNYRLGKVLRHERLTTEDIRIIEDTQPHFRTAFGTRLNHYMMIERDYGHFRRIIDATYLLRMMDPDGFQRFEPVLKQVFLHKLPEGAYVKRVNEFIEDNEKDKKGYLKTNARFQQIIKGLGLEGRKLGKGNFRYGFSKFGLDEPIYRRPSSATGGGGLRRSSADDLKPSSSSAATGGGGMRRSSADDLKPPSLSASGGGSWADRLKPPSSSVSGGGGGSWADRLKPPSSSSATGDGGGLRRSSADDLKPPSSSATGGGGLIRSSADDLEPQPDSMIASLTITEDTMTQQNVELSKGSKPLSKSWNSLFKKDDNC